MQTLLLISLSPPSCDCLLCHCTDSSQTPPRPYLPPLHMVYGISDTGRQNQGQNQSGVVPGHSICLNNWVLGTATVLAMETSTYCSLLHLFPPLILPVSPSLSSEFIDFGHSISTDYTQYGSLLPYNSFLLGPILPNTCVQILSPSLLLVFYFAAFF